MQALARLSPARAPAQKSGLCRIFYRVKVSFF
jgi:hypothetical protein